ncbi:MAG: hypothetical protein HZB51_04005 [Chloroflexi bacterium]|nr:hypothetical protein [Chloroflexota bacterium]
MRNDSVRLSMILALLLFLVTAHSVLAFDPPTWPDGLPWALPTTMPWPTARPLGVGESWSPQLNGNPVPVLTPTPTPIVRPPAPVAPVVSPLIIPVVTVAPVPVVQPPAPNPPSIPSGGSSPMNPLNPGTWMVLDSGASAWYRIGSGGVQMEVFLDADIISNMTMAIYAPGQLSRPIGMGTTWSRDTSRLAWNGGHWNSEGDWLALVTNRNATSVHYRVTSSARDISNKTCHGYWERINGGDPIFWTICE